MPGVPSTTLIHLVHPNTRSAVANASSTALQVICAWPVSGQYGPGARFLYYALIIACVFARKEEWLRDACLAAALLFPAVGALHGIVLAAVHVKDAVDMDVYGAFQLCSIGILAAPVTVRLSKTYFYKPGRNTIFLWTGLVLAGLLSLTVEFFRIGTSPCTHDDFGNPVFFNAGNFTYATNCELTCNVTNGPFSPLRGGSANNIYVIPAPDRITFGMGTLLCAACCVPAILSLVFMWNKILEINWKTRFGNQDQDGQSIGDANDPTTKQMKGVNNMIRRFLSAVEVPVFSAAVLAILIIGERNFFSYQVHYQTEPIASIGQWAPIAGTVLAALGSLYVLLATNIEAVKGESNSNTSTHDCNCSLQEFHNHQRSPSTHFMATPDAAHFRPRVSNDAGGTPSGILPTMTHSTTIQSHQGRQSFVSDTGNRRKVAEVLMKIDTFVSSAAHNMYNNSEFRLGKANDFPEIPGEEHRNVNLPQIREQYNPARGVDGNVTPLHRQSLRTGSFSGSVASGLGIEGISGMSGAESPQSPQSPQVPSPLPTTTSVLRANTLPVERGSIELSDFPESSSTEILGLSRLADTLKVPPLIYHTPRSNNSTSFNIVTPENQISPAIVVSPDPDASPLADMSPPSDLLAPSETLLTSDEREIDATRNSRE